MAETSIRNLSGETSTLNDNAYLVVADTDNNTKKIKGSVIKAEATAAAPSVVVIHGTISNGATIELPAGFTQEQCQWTVSLRQVTAQMYSSNLNCYTNADRVVTCTTSSGFGSGTATANYMIIGVK